MHISRLLLSAALFGTHSIAAETNDVFAVIAAAAAAVAAHQKDAAGVPQFVQNVNEVAPQFALLLGNTAHESGDFYYTEEIMCAGVSGPTSKCPYGWYHGRGYIQISWKDNYSKCGDAIGYDLVNNPDLVMYDPSVNWATVSWYWETSVQPTLQKRGYTLGSSVYSINGYLECGSLGGGSVQGGRVKRIQCFQSHLTGSVDYDTSC
ncbi:lysozyme-like domain-containing protein [Chytriomyces sp. MP71]|nr:lysozyme-like domain-containing protein [Chytriomyces sp. MP71]